MTDYLLEIIDDTLQRWSEKQIHQEIIIYRRKINCAEISFS